MDYAKWLYSSSQISLRKLHFEALSRQKMWEISGKNYTARRPTLHQLNSTSRLNYIYLWCMVYTVYTPCLVNKASCCPLYRIGFYSIFQGSTDIQYTLYSILSATQWHWDLFTTIYILTTPWQLSKYCTFASISLRSDCLGDKLSLADYCNLAQTSSKFGVAKK